MSISLDDLKSILQQQQVQNEAAQLKLIEALTQKLSIQVPSTSHSDKYESISNSISEFNYDPISGLVFDAWFNRYEDVFRIECYMFDDAAKVRLLLRKLGTVEHNRYVNFILPKNPRELSFDETVTVLSQIFGEQSSMFNIRYQCFQLTKMPSDDYVTYAGKVNKECERFKPHEMTSDQFKCLIFICGLKNPEDTDIRTRLLSLVEQDPKMTLQMVTAECLRLINLKHDTAMVECKRQSSEFGSINTVKSPPITVKHTARQSQNSAKPPSVCWHCGSWHFVKFCPFKKHKCRNCHRFGHKEGYCTPQKNSSVRNRSSRFKPKQSPRVQTVFTTSKVEFASKRKYITLDINGKRIRLQLDTASDITVISRTTWRKLGCPQILPTEHVAKNVSGDILKLVGEINCQVQFGEHHFNGVCYVTNYHDLDLLGLDWLDKLHIFNVPLNSVCSNVSSSPHNVVPGDVSDQSLLQRRRQKHASVFQDKLGCCKLFGIQHIRSPPYHPQSNGQTERFVDTFKRAYAKAKGEGTTEKFWINSCCIIVRMKKDSYVSDTQITLYPVPRKGQLDKEELRNLFK
uniref:DUF7083 domain-containing protein n=1 Tax=Trichobilharzia regenti TaxID=157069 RepID=A0AA85J4N5_TRIRE|nr:unnamed protein product [Trichobilharzia regenti]